jgi:hypothetical protein
MLLEFVDTTVRQCAWCLFVMDRSGAYSVVSSRKLKAATHGICPSCKAAVRAEIDAQPVAA